MELELERLGIHESVAQVFPPAELADYLADLPVAVSVIGDDGITACDAVVTLEYREAVLEVDWVHSIQAGVDRFPFDALEDAGVVLTNSTGIHDRTVGETVAGYLLSFSRRLHDHVANQQERRWERPEWDAAFTLPGSTACVVGTGTLGTGVAETLGGLGVDLRGVRRSGDPVPGFGEVYANDRLLEAIADVEFVIVTVPLTDETHHLFDAAAFEAMRDDAYFVNVARGSVVDEPALIDALEADALAGAALDVFEEEPLPEDSPLWGMDEVIVSPHCAAYTRDYFRDTGDIVRENVDRLETGEEFHNRVV
ncbi:D-isomer specific 2-hydroxyacid dehydrogenase NAD-binding protein [Natrinema pellirubrum DSM 15624]|uniref:D-isomer specific 2-hydroxyacid dehydrogenase NAD-binding protein n=1 Tax=Natrinema pellirubrum (strain DSM 15624 / CIP 106293 / JCM 10476 / NCIMB 786 / 157) TaxID=797303 RepID=L0JIN5_NATP1|nr:D-2-hydroxyacid dehydrogenase [Natrinema pellirubrum]AGB30196.1 phosphoglycerate dehydrogenase-like oxidoreductase [Natrinema pellirubrum DSM 15624]ELY78477.1 D-isomer specific 2-hydroxyacid dehydrogenase NAD-binding protein [Natrinema pellirubrum DSM 15624]